jgi:transcriptional regulator with XRE-family HTH domain
MTNDTRAAQDYVRHVERRTRRRGIPLPYLSAWRFRRLLTQQQLGDMAGVQQHTIYRLESRGDKAEFKTIRKIAAALDITPEQLLEVNPDSEVK